MNTSVQSVYTRNTANAYPGMGYDISSGEHKGRLVEGEFVFFGAVAVQGTGDNQCKLPDAAGQRVIGVAERVMRSEHREGAQLPPFGDAVHCLGAPEQCAIPLRTQGRIWVVVENDVVAGDPVFFRHTATGVQLRGAIRGVDDGGGTCDPLTGVTFDTSAAAGGFAVIDLNGLRGA